MSPTSRECPLCHGEGAPVGSYRGSYDRDVYHYTFVRTFYRCGTPRCTTVFFLDEIDGKTEAVNWEEERIEEAERVESHCQDLLESEVYTTMLRAREASDDTVTKNREMQKQVKEINTEIAQKQDDLDHFMERMRNFAWEDDRAIHAWIQDNWLPPVFAEKTLENNFGMSRPILRKDLPEEARALIVGPDNPLYEAGQAILHQRWGEGRVVEGNPDGGSIITAEFPDVGMKKMDLRYAKLEKVAAPRGRKRKAVPRPAQDVTVPE